MPIFRVHAGGVGRSKWHALRNLTLFIPCPRSIFPKSLSKIHTAQQAPGPLKPHNHLCRHIEHNTMASHERRRMTSCAAHHFNITGRLSNLQGEMAYVTFYHLSHSSFCCDQSVIFIGRLHHLPFGRRNAYPDCCGKTARDFVKRSFLLASQSSTPCLGKHRRSKTTSNATLRFSIRHPTTHH
jgi:hypothetical protein